MRTHAGAVPGSMLRMIRRRFLADTGGGPSEGATLVQVGLYACLETGI